MFTLSCPSLRKAIFDTMTLSRALLSTSPTLASPNTFHQFVKARYMEIKQKNPSLKTAELMRKVGEEYRKLTDAERVQFKLSEPTPDLIKRHSEKRKRLMYAHRHGMPRRPSFSGMNIFIREKLCDLKGQPIRKVSARFKEAVEEWKKLSSTEKARPPGCTYCPRCVEISREMARARWLKWLEREFTDRKVRGSNATSASRLPLSRLGQPGSIPALVLPSGGRAAMRRKGVTAERQPTTKALVGFYSVLHTVVSFSTANILEDSM
ncbi:hypothetical protein CRM22_004085 [Opisthorchis felineus]|nr:hypothetical protein CRM22_004085 [Opisthorchis felineus]